MVLATSAVRDADNGRLVAEEASRLGLAPRVLPGEEEARLGVLAVANALPLGEALVVDQGGGSAQVSLMAGRRFLWGRALPLGASGSPRASWSPTPRAGRRSGPWSGPWKGT